MTSDYLDPKIPENQGCRQHHVNFGTQILSWVEAQSCIILEIRKRVCMAARWHNKTYSQEQNLTQPTLSLEQHTYNEKDLLQTVGFESPCYKYYLTQVIPNMKRYDFPSFNIFGYDFYIIILCIINYF